MLKTFSNGTELSLKSSLTEPTGLESGVSAAGGSGSFSNGLKVGAGGGGGGATGISGAGAGS